MPGERAGRGARHGAKERRVLEDGELDLLRRRLVGIGRVAAVESPGLRDRVPEARGAVAVDASPARVFRPRVARGGQLQALPLFRGGRDGDRSVAADGALVRWVGSLRPDQVGEATPGPRHLEHQLPVGRGSSNRNHSSRSTKRNCPMGERTHHSCSDPLERTCIGFRETSADLRGGPAELRGGPSKE
eukprot:gene6834-biopygen10100